MALVPDCGDRGARVRANLTDVGASSTKSAPHSKILAKFDKSWTNFDQTWAECSTKARPASTKLGRVQTEFGQTSTKVGRKLTRFNSSSADFGRFRPMLARRQQLLADFDKLWFRPKLAAFGQCWPDVDNSLLISTESGSA